MAITSDAAAGDEKFGVCPSCGKPLSQKRDSQINWVVNGLCALVFLGLMGTIFYVRNPQMFGQGPTGPSYDGPVRFNTRRGVTASHYAQIKPGMTYKQVSALLGSSGTRTGSARLEGALAETYLWQNSNGSNLGATFRGGKLALKSNFKL